MAATIHLIGNVGAEPEIKFSQDGTKIATIRLAVTPRGAGGKNKTDWYRITAWRKQAELVEQYVHKGNKLYVSGSFTTSEFTGKDNVKRTTLEVSLNDIEFLTPKGAQTDAPADDDTDAWL